MTSQHVWNISLFQHFFQVLSLYLEARNRIRIHFKVKGIVRIRIKVTSRIRIRIKVIWIRNTADKHQNKIIQDEFGNLTCSYLVRTGTCCPHDPDWGPCDGCRSWWREGGRDCCWWFPLGRAPPTEITTSLSRLQIKIVTIYKNFSSNHEFFNNIYSSPVCGK
jgi:hypothetical protein